MHFYPTERIGLFIDAPNLTMAMRGLGWELDYTLLAHWFAKQGYLVQKRFYTALPEKEYASMRALVDFLDFNGWHVVSKPVKQITDYSTGTITRKGNMDVEIATDMLRLAPTLDHLVLFSGDGDFRRVLDVLQDMGKRASIASTTRGSEKVIADELRRQADIFIELDELKKDIARDPAARVKAGLTITTKPPARAAAG